jgi:hypothetical protein
LTPRLTARFGSTHTVAAGMLLLGMGMFSLSFLAIDTAYLFIAGSIVMLMVGIGLSMPPMTSAVMSGVPTRRAGAGSATNDATREIGGALGIAVIGSIAASRYASEIQPAIKNLPSSAQEVAKGSLVGGTRVAASLPAEAGSALAASAKHAFVDGIHLAGTIGAAFAVVSIFVVLRYLPRNTIQQGARPAPADAPRAVGALDLAAAPTAVADD